MLTGLVKKLAWKIGVGRITSKIRDAAEGRLGPEWKARYEWTIGKKRLWGFIGGAVASLLLYLDVDKTGVVVLTISGLLLQWGFLDAAWRKDIPEWLATSTLYRVLVSLSAEITAAMGSLWVAMQTQDCAGISAEYCGQAKIAVLVVGALLAQMGVLDAAWRSPKPRQVAIPDREPCLRCGRAEDHEAHLQPYGVKYTAGGNVFVSHPHER